MTPEGPAHLVAWSWRCRMVGSPTAAADISSYPPLGTDAKDTLVVPWSCFARESTHFHRTGFPRTVSGLLWGGNCAKSSGACVRVPVRVRSRLSLGQCGQVSVVAWPLCDQVPVVAWFQRDQAPVVADPDQAPCGQAGSSAWKLPTRPGLSAHARTSRQPCTELPPEAALRGNRATTQSSEAANARPRRGSGNPAAWAGVAMPRYWVCAGDDVVTQHRSGLRTGSSSAIHAR